MKAPAPGGAISPWRVWTARAVAVAADCVQLGLIPAFGPGAVSPFEDALDVAVAVALTALVGWHWAFLPAIGAELIPVVDLVPTWTAAAFLATRLHATPPPQARAANQR
jgi:hypothetical protein